MSRVLREFMKKIKLVQIVPLKDDGQPDFFQARTIVGLGGSPQVITATGKTADETLENLLIAYLRLQN